MERIHRIGIAIGLLVLALVAIYKFWPKNEPHYTAEATIELIRVDPASLGEEEKENEIELEYSSEDPAQKKVDPDAVVNASAAAGKPENHLHD